MTVTLSAVRSFFADDDGNLVLFQKPNPPLYGWIIFKALAWATASGRPQAGFEVLSIACLFIWAFLESISGVSYFRKVLGISVLLLLTRNILR